MKNTSTRILILAALALGVHGVGASMRFGLKPAKVSEPDRDFHEIPLQFDQWTGHEFDLKSEDPTLYERIGAETVIQRKYQGPQGRAVALHCAVFTEYDVGALHLPTNCYRSQGWALADSEALDLEGPDGSKKRVILMTWKQNGELPALACYWYQLDEHVILDRFDLGKVRLSLGGREVWPPLIKVLITSTLTDPQQSPEDVRKFAQWVYTWINAPLDKSGLPEPGLP